MFTPLRRQVLLSRTLETARSGIGFDQVQALKLVALCVDLSRHRSLEETYGSLFQFHDLLFLTALNGRVQTVEDVEAPIFASSWFEKPVDTCLRKLWSPRLLRANSAIHAV